MTDTFASSLTIVCVLIILLGILRLRHVSIQTLVLGLIGAIIGLLVSALASVSLGQLPQPMGGLIAVLLTIFMTGTAIIVTLSQRNQLLKLLPFLVLDQSATPKNKDKEDDAPSTPSNRVLLDTSVVIDGRIADIADAGFVPGILVAPRFMLAELQNIADSDDAMRRGRGRRGLEVLNRLRETVGVTVEVTDEDVQGTREVDAKLVIVAQRHGWSVLTTDYNLNRVAQIQGVRVLNVNELSNAIRPVVLPGEPLMVRVVQPGKERNQGVGYLADGTMIVVENGDKLMGQEVETEVTRVFQTVAGKMIFAVPRKGVVPQPASASATPAPTPATAVAPAVDAVAEAAVEQPTRPAAASGHGRPSRGQRGRGNGGNGNPTNANPANTGTNPNSGHKRPSGSSSIEERLVRATQGQATPTEPAKPAKIDQPQQPADRS